MEDDKWKEERELFEDFLDMDSFLERRTKYVEERENASDVSSDEKSYLRRQRKYIANAEREITLQNATKNKENHSPPIKTVYLFEKEKEICFQRLVQME
jgi:hypothetical protein